MWDHISGGSIFHRRCSVKPRSVHAGVEKRGNGTLRSGHIPGDKKYARIFKNIMLPCSFPIGDNTKPGYPWWEGSWNRFWTWIAPRRKTRHVLKCKNIQGLEMNAFKDFFQPLILQVFHFSPVTSRYFKFKVIFQIRFCFMLLIL